MIIRIEEEKDYKKVENLTREAFYNVYRPGCIEHYILHKFRKSDSFIKELSLLMVDEKSDTIIAHIMYCKTFIKTIDNDEIEILMFGPVSVLPEFQKKGYGSKLIEYSLEKAKELGFRAVAITGDPKYYSRFGFKEAKDFNVYYNDMKKDEEASFFMIKELVSSYLNVKEGRLIEPIEYQSFDEEKFNNYDLAFPEKEKLVLETQLF